MKYECIWLEKQKEKNEGRAILFYKTNKNCIVAASIELDRQYFKTSPTFFLFLVLFLFKIYENSCP